MLFRLLRVTKATNDHQMTFVKTKHWPACLERIAQLIQEGDLKLEAGDELRIAESIHRMIED